MSDDVPSSVIARLLLVRLMSSCSSILVPLYVYSVTFSLLFVASFTVGEVCVEINFIQFIPKLNYSIRIWMECSICVLLLRCLKWICTQDFAIFM
jgi:hypothetical protein